MSDDEPGFEKKRDAKYRDLRKVVEETRDQRRAGKAHLFALEIPMSVIVGAVLGKLADDYWGIAPWGVTVGLVAGLGSAVRAIVRLIAWQKQNDREDEAAAARAAPAPGGSDDRPR